MKPTEQQMNVIAAAVKELMLKIEACAGGGKTSTLVLVANAIPLKSCYLAFNKVTAEEAQGRFPSHVTCATTHSFAFRAFGGQLMHKLTRPKGRYVNVAGTGSEIANFYRIDAVEGASGAALGAYVKKTVERFEQSADDALTMKHVPKKDMEKLLKEAPEAAGIVLKYAQRLWKDRINVDSEVLASHDTYLKQFQLSKPVLPYEVVYVDEFQDTTPCVLDIIMNQKHAKIVMVGDRRQAIYGWRGAVNAMQSVHCAEAPLSMSFRYGQGIADVATHVLKGDMKVMGRTDLKSIVGFNTVDRTKPHAFLFRTNALLLIEAVKAIDKGQKVAVEIDVKDFVKLLESAMALHKGTMKQVKHEKILPYASWWKMVEEAGEIGGELKRLVGIVEGGQGEHIISVLEGYKAPLNPIATYTTAHKSKGREFDQVILAEDFPSHYKKGEFVGLNEAEENLLYVAVTRSMRVLEINESVAEALDLVKYEYLGELDTDIEEQDARDREATGEGVMPDVDFRRLARQEAKMVNSIIHGDGLPF